MSTFKYLVIVAFLDWCGTHPPIWRPPHFPQDVDPSKEMQGWMTKPWVGQAITRIYYFMLAALIVLVMITHHEAAFSLEYGPFMCVPGYRVVVGLLPMYKPYPGVWDKIKEKSSHTPLPGVWDKVKASTGSNPLTGSPEKK